LPGRCFVRAAWWVVSCALAWAPAAAQAPHYPGAWLDGAATQQELAGAAQRGVANVAVYGSSERIERVDAFYRQFYQALPGTGPARFCLERVERPEACRRYVEVNATGGGSRIRVFELR
jgi:hypothetical protein